MPAGYTVIRETPAKPFKPPVLPLMVTIKDRHGIPQDIPCCKAFEMYGDSFVAHPTIGRPGFWNVTHALTGAAACTPEKSKAAAIRKARENLERAGADGFAKAKGYAIQSKGNK